MRVKPHLSVLLTLILPTFLPAQTFSPSFNGISILRSGQTLANPLSGGMETPYIQFVDIDSDGDRDLFVLDRDSRLHFFENDSGTTQPHWVIRNDHYEGLSVQQWFRFADIDGDGDEDLFTGGQGSTVRWYRNVGSSKNALFASGAVALKDSAGNSMLSENISIPAFADADGDGDLDFFSGNSVGSIWYYENRGSAQQPEFRFITDTYQGIVIIGSGGTAVRDSGQSGVFSAAQSLHGAMSLDFADIDADGDLDMFWGDFFSKSLYFLRNTGTTTSPQFILADSTFPDETPVFTPGFNMPGIFDADGDGDLDMFIAVVSGLRSTGNMVYYRNNGSPSVHAFTLASTDPLGQFDVGAATSPVVGDWNMDGIPDMLLGTEDGRIVELQGSGPSHETFAVTSDSFLVLNGMFNLAPAIADLYGDGIPELIVGDFSGRLRLFNRSPMLSEDTTFSLRGMFFGTNASPAAGDIDNDGDIDIVAGNGGGQLVFIENIGSSTSALLVVRTTSFGNIDVGDDAKPTLSDVNGDGRMDLVVGSRDGGIRTWISAGGNFYENPMITFSTTGIVRSAPAILKNSTSVSLIVGNVKGGLYFYKASGSPVASLDNVKLEPVFPNPAKDEVTVLSSLPESGKFRLTVIDMLGREVLTLPEFMRGPGYFVDTFSVRELASGAYVAWLLHDSGYTARSFIVIH